jgi:hypothetical protein
MPQHGIAAQSAAGRGLATSLNRVGVQDKTIQAILRHANYPPP